MRIDQYKFHNICNQMGKEFGVIRHGDEDYYMGLLFPMESNLLKVHRKYPSSNSRRLLEAISLALFQIKSRLTDEEYNLDKFRSEDNERLVHALLMAFDPYANEEIRAAMGEEKWNALDDKDALREYYTIPVRCIIRINESIETFGKHLGADGYFDFIEGNIGKLIPEDDKLNFSILV